MSKALAYIVERLREPTTWSGIATALTGMGVAIEPDLWKEIMGIGMSVAGILLTVTKERQP